MMMPRACVPLDLYVIYVYVFLYMDGVVYALTRLERWCWLRENKARETHTFTQPSMSFHWKAAAAAGDDDDNADRRLYTGKCMFGSRRAFHLSPSNAPTRQRRIIYDVRMHSGIYKYENVARYILTRIYLLEIGT